MSLGGFRESNFWGRFPRVSGDEPKPVENYWLEDKFSPRERG